MKKPPVSKFLVILSSALVLVACNAPSESKAKLADKKEMNATDDGEMLPDVQADRMLVVELEGMVCQMGCGGSIREDLYASKGVASVSFDFDEDNPVDVARVAFNREKISADQIVSIISKTKDGQFKVKSSHSEPYIDDSPKVKESAESSKNSKNAKISIKSTANVDVPDVFDVFSYVL